MRTAVTCALAAAWGTCMLACSPFSGGGAFTCTDSTQCSSGGVMGTCEANGYCSFLDPNCPSGSRYGDASGPNANRCVGEEVPIDAREPDALVIDAPLAVDAACNIGGLDLCARQPLGPLNVAISETLNTTDDPRCQDLTQDTGPTACLVYVSSVSIGAGATLQVIGSRPLVIASAGSIAISGALDASSYRGGPTGAGANFASCAQETQPSDDVGGGGGGAGGSFAGEGGDGGEGDSDNSLPPNATTGTPGTATDALAAPPGFARGGCPGGRGGDEDDGFFDGRGGSGGAGGGVVWLFANDVIGVSGVVRATGAGGSGGGDQAGAGGGGSGGYIKLVANTINVQGTIAANGGGGGEGGCQCGGLPLTGDSGGNGNASNVQADGGSSTGMPGGDGGRAAANTVLDGSDGSDSIVGGGGGGGGAGYVVLVGNVTVSGTVSPPAL